MLSTTQERIERLLMTIDQLGMVKIKHLQQIHNLKSYRNACRVVNQLKPYVHEMYYDREKVIYLNKQGRDLIGSKKEESKRNLIMNHTFLRNDVYIHFGCPHDWKNEHHLETEIEAPNKFGINFGNMAVVNKKKVVSDAVFKRNGYLHLIEVDNARKMIDNKKKIEAYRDILPAYREQTPILYFFTTTEDRKRKFELMLKGVRHEVKTFEEIK